MPSADERAAVPTPSAWHGPLQRSPGSHLEAAFQSLLPTL